MFFIVAIHVAPFAGNHVLANYMIQKCIARIGVPFFFIATGFFLRKKLQVLVQRDQLKLLNTYIKKVFTMYIVWTFLYLPAIIKNIVANKNGIGYGLLFAVRDLLFVGSYTHLWYLHATIIAVGLYTILHIMGGWRKSSLLLVSMVLYLLGLLGQTYFSLILPLKEYTAVWNFLLFIQDVIVQTRNGLFEGLFFVVIGTIIADNENWLSCISKKKCFLYFLATLILLIFESYIVRIYDMALHWNMYIVLPLAAISLFLYALNMLNGANEDFLDSITSDIRSITTMIYLIHLWVRWFVVSLLKVPTGISFITVYICSLLFAILWTKTIRPNLSRKTILK